MGREGNESVRRSGEPGYISDVRSLKALGDKFAKVSDESGSSKFRQGFSNDKNNIDSNMARPPHQKENLARNNGDTYYGSENIQKSKQAFVKTMENMGALVTRIAFLEQRTSKIQDFCALQLSVFQLTLNTLTSSFNKNFEVNLSESSTPGATLTQHIVEDIRSLQPENTPIEETLQENTTNIITETSNNDSNTTFQETVPKQRQPAIKKEKSQIEDYLEMDLWTSNTNQQGNTIPQTVDKEKQIGSKGGQERIQITKTHSKNVNASHEKNIQISNGNPDKSPEINDDELTKNHDAYKLSCSECHYEAATLQGLRLHVTKTHKNKDRNIVATPSSKEIVQDIRVQGTSNVTISKKRGRKSKSQIPIPAITYDTSNSEKPHTSANTEFTNKQESIIASTSFSPKPTTHHSSDLNLDSGYKELRNDSISAVAGRTPSKDNLPSHQFNTDVPSTLKKKDAPLNGGDNVVKNMQTWIDDIEKMKSAYGTTGDNPTFGGGAELNVEEDQTDLHKQTSDAQQCDLCDFVPKCKNNTSAKSTLRLHIKAIHDKVKDQICTLCQYRTTHKGNLVTHCKKHHSGAGIPEPGSKENGKNKRGKSKVLEALTYDSDH